ncbi:MAG: hypothetical protein U1B94_09570 [candidate division NC10 bacterium]|nr:hypothetical protein [candidate division NC10 bacterium]
MGVVTFVQPDAGSQTGQTGSAYKSAIDGAVSVLKRISQAFAPHEQATPNMTVRLDAGFIFSGGTLTEVAAQNSATITAPTTNPRIDRIVVDEATGTVSVIAGTEAASPTAPAITAGKLPVAQVLLQTSTTQITNAIITDERAWGLMELPARRFRETGGPDVLSMGAVPDGKVFKRSGSTIIGGEASPVLNRDVTENEVVNTAAETTVYSFSVPGGTLGTDKMLRLTLLGSYLNNSGAGSEITYRVKYGATTIMTALTRVFASDASRRAVRLICLLAAQNATNAQVAHGDELTCNPGGVAGATTDFDTGEHRTGFHDSIAEDSTAAKTLSVTVQWGGANAARSFKCEVVQLELL